MEFSKTDLTIIIAMTLAIIMMSFTFSATGLVGEKKANESDIPEFQQSNESYDFAGEFPSDVDRSELGGGQINISDINTDNFVYPLPQDAQISGFNESDNFAEPTWKVRLDSGDGTVIYDKENVSLGEEFYLNDTANYELQGEFYENDEGYQMLEYRAIQGSTNKYSGIVGGILRIADILYWFAGTIITVFTNAFANLFEVVVFLFDLLNWQIDTYTAIVDSASSWASIMVLVPGIVLMAEFAKIATLVVEVLWVG